MKAKSFIKRELALLLVVVLLVSCWVFAQPTSTEVNAAAGTYSGTATMQTTDTCDCDDNAGARVYVVTRNKNGNDNDEKTIEITGYTSSVQAGSTESKPFTTEAGYFPISVYAKIDIDAGGFRNWKGYLSVTVDGKEIMKTSEMEISHNDLWVHSDKTTGSANCAASNYPSPQYMNSLSGTNVTVPTSGTATSTITKGTIYDQYGVEWYNQSSSTYVVSGTGYSVSGQNIAVSSSAMATADPWYTTATIGVKYGDTVLKQSKGSSTNRTCTIRATNPSYTVTWRWHTDGDASTTWSGSTTSSAYYNQTPSAPSGATGVTKYYDSSQHHSGGSYNPTKITADKTFDMSYSSNGNHSYNYTELASSHANYHTKHTGTCTTSTCGYSAQFNHSYGATTFSWADDGKSATATRQCSTTGCKHIQTGSVSLGSGITSAITTNETCTAVGTTTYTATSPFGDGATATKAVNDRPALGHSWGGWGPHSGTEHIRTCSRCGATDTAAHTYPADPSYTSNGNGKTNTHYYSCTTSGCTYRNTSTHTWDDGTVTTPETCTETGIKTYHCTAKGCSGTYTETIPAKGH
ncbi:MAG: hypothetical protein IKE65_05375, partial [Clostridia bacterium]|nr:hypothetical protein [Clostridia bacterium]